MKSDNSSNSNNFSILFTHPKNLHRTKFLLALKFYLVSMTSKVTPAHERHPPNITSSIEDSKRNIRNKLTRFFAPTLILSGFRSCPGLQDFPVNVQVNKTIIVFGSESVLFI